MRTIFVFLIIIIASHVANAQISNGIQYGNNPANGHYLKVGDSTKIYYEVYGKGRPVVLLHGGLFGDISEYEKLIPKLSEHFQVIAIETRGHAKSEIGHQLFTYKLMAQDAYTVIKHLTSDSTIVIGFSDGAVIAMNLTIEHPEIVRKLVFAGGNISKEDYRPGVTADLEKTTGKTMEMDYPDFVKDRKKLMPEPERWDEFVDKLKHAWLTQVKVEPSELKNVKCPVLVVGGDRDQYNTIDNFYKVYKQLPNASLAIIPQSDHIVFYRRPEVMEAIVMPFVN
ncbi:alpha/beta fold hydrolase [Mucilaginibacter sp. OK098]|uniref:alpha/beta fold hydrolase n=1 Tax=Mucilaginibacter sp. OK098 TaxID=1855297 RepID=UPI0009191382|nr:alpha/beta hydrolase [Mucilaginibacter sp. OK098]SHN27734.1 Pimeloyl-ACP methyl ester carboxylesterase [Mucilaginibacter sp. OK098]